ncbi:hypothetical protein CsSME_00015137 [Camellia sinensis var. sinensis]
MKWDLKRCEGQCKDVTHSRTNKKKRKHEEAKSIDATTLTLLYTYPAVAEVKLEVDKLAAEVDPFYYFFQYYPCTSKERKVEEVKSDMLLRACAAIAKVSTLEAVMNGGTKRKGSNLTTKGDEADRIDYKRGRI